MTILKGDFPSLQVNKLKTGTLSKVFYSLSFTLLLLLGSCAKSPLDAKSKSIETDSATADSAATSTAPSNPANSPSSLNKVEKKPLVQPSVVSKSSSETQKNSRTKKSSSTPQTANKSRFDRPKSVSVNVYKLDNQCKNLVAEKVALPADQPITKAVGKVLENTNNADFSLSGYRVNVKSGVATIDLRMTPGSTRRFGSLSTCEQRALFGSLRKTLTSYAPWKIKTVRFTDRGRVIAL